MCGDGFTFWGRCGDWILTAQWPWDVLAISTKQYVHSYHRTRHKSLSPWWTLNQVLVSGWEQRAAANQRGQKGRPSSPHNCIRQENYQVGKCKQKLQKVFIRLPSGGLGQQSWGTSRSVCIWLQGCEFLSNPQPSHGFCFSFSKVVCGHVQTVNYSVQDSWLKKCPVNHNVMFLFNTHSATCPWKYGTHLTAKATFTSD